MSDRETIEFDKLVRDNVPELIRQSGDTPETHVADDSEYRQRLREKLIEEATEFRETGATEELADVLAVVGAICRTDDIDREEVERLGREKTHERGGFEERIVLERVRK
ncbi:nucleoside triphosphate pyrophosphohydrolase [Halogranum rubrum]|uniref:Phosphoribosyl-ATP pyrophosphohydrolase n=1 Tax=Halogranum salarium B-1 TaxID=1210908 RepID=J3JEY2_9EURY|nr:nucleoside triphosphate pyrophosphohydrolase [Halogranum salarium]EJN58759.1 hypothetical protein HSB1_28400 [Halogranum salarium B-1]